MSFERKLRLMTKWLICGSRVWKDSDTLFQKLDEYTEERGGVPDLVIEGGARGADTMGRLWAHSRGIKVKTMPADWDTHGKAAGPIRNRAMLDEKPDLVIAFILGASRGTYNTLNEATKRGIDTIGYHRHTPIYIPYEDSE